MAENSFKPPWSTKESFSAVNDAFSRIILRHRDALKPVRALAEEIQLTLISLDPIMDRLCSDTCPNCSDPCCIVGTVWYDFTDLLYLNLLNIPRPPGQLMASTNDVCRYLSPAGCLLKRSHRPWVCTHYLCPPQLSILRKKGRQSKKRVETAESLIKQHRKKIEVHYISITSGINETP